MVNFANYPQHIITQIYRLVILATLGLAGCATFEPGADRIIIEGSLAKVGPLKSEDLEPVAQAPVVITDEEIVVETPVDSQESPQVTDDSAQVSSADSSNTQPAVTTLPTSDVKNKTTPQTPSGEARSVSNQTLDGAKATQLPEQTPTKPVPTEKIKSNIKTNSITDTQAVTDAQPVTVPNPKTDRPKPNVVTGSLTGTVTVLGKDGEILENQSSIVTIEPLDDSITIKRSERMRHFVDMEEKIYKPRYLIIHAEDVVSFVNKDEIKHNVFSSSDLNAFDLGTFGAKKWRDVVLSAEGVVKVYCNIHPEMASFIKVDKRGLSTVSEAEQGQFKFTDVPAGEYRLSVWHVRGTHEQTISILKEQVAQTTIKLDTTDFQKTERKNKFGKSYQTGTALFDDEFY